MKKRKLGVFIMIATAFISCSNDKEEKHEIDPNSVISVQIESKKVRGSDDHAKFIVKYAFDYTTTKGISYFGITPDLYYRQRDTVNNKILFMGWDVIDNDGQMGEFLYCRNIILRIALDSEKKPLFTLGYTGSLDLDYDTVAYIPNALMDRNLIQLTKLFDAGDYEGCYQMFDTAYSFIPISGEEYRKLVNDGIEKPQ